MLTIVEGQKLPEKPHARAKILFRCDCGNYKWIYWKNYTQNHTKSCGNCKKKLYTEENLLKKKFNHLIVDPNQQFPLNITSKCKLIFICDCGNKKPIVIKSVLNNLTKACGCGLSHKKGNKNKTPIYKTKNEWLNERLPCKLLDINLPDKWSHGTSQIMNFMCKCGNIFTTTFGKVHSGHKTTCGKCNFIKKESVLGKKFGKIQLLDINLPNWFHVRTTKKFTFKCDCGRIKLIAWSSIIKQNQTTCGDCNLRPAEWWKDKVFGHLKVLELFDLKTGSECKIKCLCTCGQITYPTTHDLTTGHTKTCGFCLEKAKNWHETHNFLPPKEKLYQHKCSVGTYRKIDLEKYFDGSFLIPLEDIRSVESYARFICKLCGQEFKTKLAWIYYNKIMTCGCVQGSTSAANIEIGKFIETLGLEAKFSKNELIIGKYKYDITVESKKLIIEHNGLRYHSTEFKTFKKITDIEKYQKAISLGYQYLMIYEDEWKHKKELFKQLIKNKLGLSKPISIRPNKCIIRLISNKETIDFYGKYHYQGHVNASYNFGVYYQNKLITCMSIKKPTRQKSGDWEIIRMTCNYDYKIHGIWSFLMNFIKKNKIIFGKLVSFSDNRLMTGNVYKKIGMSFITEIKPDYYWVKNNKRFHKSSLRKTPTEKLSGKTEVELRTEQGYYQIFDLGKKKWEIILT